VLRIGAWALVIFGALLVVVSLLAYVRRGAALMPPSQELHVAAVPRRAAQQQHARRRVRHPKRIARRAVNIGKGRLLARLGFWRWLWR
jgi:hypothetical protein